MLMPIARRRMLHWPTPAEWRLCRLWQAEQRREQRRQEALEDDQGSQESMGEDSG